MSHAQITFAMLPLLGMLLCAACTDLSARRIPNWLTFPMIGTGILQSLFPLHTVSPGPAALGLVVGFGLTFVLFAIGALGAGDVKLLAGVGAWMGPGPVLAVFLIETVIGMVIVLGQASWQGRLATLFRNTAVVTVNMVHLREVGVDHVRETGASCRSVDRPLPYAVPVLLSVIVVLAFTGR